MQPDITVGNLDDVKVHHVMVVKEALDHLLKYVMW